MTPEQIQTAQQQESLKQEIIAEAQEEVQSVLRDLHNFWMESQNLVPEIEKDTLADLSSKVEDEYKIDRDSLSTWREELREAHNLARQMKDGRTYAGETISDIKYPLISYTCVQFQARAFPSIVKDGKVVRPKVVGKDDGGVKAARGQRVSDFMSWQLVDDNDHWVDDVDGALMGLPLWGCMFKKTYRGAEKNESDTIYPEDLVVHYFAKDFEPRATHRIFLYPNEIKERILDGRFIDFEYGQATNNEDDGESVNQERDEDNREQDDDNPHLFLEQHRWYDLDGDGYKEPYIVTMHWDTKTIVRVSVRWCSEDAKYAEDGKTIISIKPFKTFTKIPFMPAFDGSFYCMGFGRLLSPLNHAIDTILNQLIDAGGYQNRPAGFISTGVRFGKQNKTIQFKKGEWKKIQSAGNLKDNIFQLNFGEPSLVLFQTLGLLMEASNRLASMSDVLAGEVPKGDIPAATTLSIIEQGLKVYTAVHLRIHRALKQEFKKLRRLNRLYALQMQDQYVKVIEEDADAHMDFGYDDYDIVPVSNESDISDTMRTLKADALMAQKGTGMNDKKIQEIWLEAHGFPATKELLESPPQPPDPLIVIEERKVQVKEMEVELSKLEFLANQQERVYKMLKMYAEAINKFADAEAKEMGSQMQEYQTYVQGALATAQEFSKAIGGSLGGKVQQGNVRQVEEGPGNTGVLPQAGGGNVAAGGMVG